MAKFKQEILNKIKADPQLFAVVSEVMNVKPISLPVILDRNNQNLNQYSVVVAVANYLNASPDEMVEEDTEMEAQGTKS